MRPECPRMPSRCRLLARSSRLQSARQRWRPVHPVIDPFLLSPCAADLPPMNALRLCRLRGADPPRSVLSIWIAEKVEAVPTAEVIKPETVECAGCAGHEDAMTAAPQD